jgi:hypothetical protein
MSRPTVIDVKPAVVKGAVHSSRARVVTDGERLIVLTGATPDQRREFKVTSVERKPRTSTYQATTVEGDTIEFGPGGGCTCGKPWMKSAYTKVLANG